MFGIPEFQKRKKLMMAILLMVLVIGFVFGALFGGLFVVGVFIFIRLTKEKKTENNGKKRYNLE